MPDLTRLTSSRTLIGVYYKSTMLLVSLHARRLGYLLIDLLRSMGLTITICIVLLPNMIAYNLVSKSLPSSPRPACYLDIKIAYLHSVLSCEVYI